jgi:predicted dehydrogenase
MERINVGVIGSGYWGPNLIRNLVELASSNLMAVADLREDRLAHIKTRYPGVKVTTDYRDMFSMPLDAIVVATPPATHFRIAYDCMQNDRHVLVEKPLTLSSLEAEELIGLAEMRGLTMMVGHTFEYNAAVRALKDLVRSGELGEIHYVDGVRVNLGLFQRDLDVIWDLAPHDISILLYVLGLDPITVSAQGADCIFEGKHDVAYLNVRFPGGILAHLRLSWLDPCKVRRITVVGSQKMLVYDDVDMLETIKIYDKRIEAPRYTETFGDFQCEYRSGDVVVPKIEFTEPLRAECQHFLESVINGTTPQSSGLVGLKVVRTLEAAERSLRNGGMAESVLWSPAVAPCAELGGEERLGPGLDGPVLPVEEWPDEEPKTKEELNRERIAA